MEGARRKSVRQLQKTINFWSSPITTLQFAGSAIVSFLWSSGIYVASHWLFYLVVLPITLVWIGLAHIDGPHSATVADATLSLWFVLWWLLLGILSSIGLGTGMQTGMLFLFPHILKVVYTAEECRTLDFETRTNVWLNPDIPQSQLMLLPSCAPEADAPFPSYLGLVGKVMVAALVWGVGTAVGEIPPYHFAYLAASKGEVDEELQAELDGIKEGGDGLSWTTRMFNDMKAWMIDFIKNNGFLGIYLMSAWPNAAFDLCGMCCGHFQMDFWTFFGALLLGKAFTLRSLQAFGFVAVFSHQYRPKLIKAVGFVVPQAADMLSSKIEDFIAGVEAGSAGDGNGPPLIAKIWGGFIMVLVGYFLFHATEAIAQEHVKALSDEELHKRLPRLHTD
mmetsp:Transcript_31855/g.83473  ORF Transcript_31855/g.83473 Transcript_31855/m.83473 type:complete len:392 (-) Transcript_31855:55-1230(-)